MEYRELADNFWAAVSRAYDAPKPHIKESRCKKAIHLFAEIVRQCDIFQGDFHTDPVDLANDFIRFTSNDYNQEFDRSETLDEEFYEYGINLAKLGANAYYS